MGPVRGILRNVTIADLFKNRESGVIQDEKIVDCDYRSVSSLRDHVLIKRVMDLGERSSFSLSLSLQSPPHRTLELVSAYRRSVNFLKKSKSSQHRFYSIFLKPRPESVNLHTQNVSIFFPLEVIPAHHHQRVITRETKCRRCPRRRIC
jgi:hypothetical protein